MVVRGAGSWGGKRELTEDPSLARFPFAKCVSLVFLLKERWQKKSDWVDENGRSAVMAMATVQLGNR